MVHCYYLGQWEWGCANDAVGLLMMHYTDNIIATNDCEVNMKEAPLFTRGLQNTPTWSGRKPFDGSDSTSAHWQANVSFVLHWKVRLMAWQKCVLVPLHRV